MGNTDVVIIGGGIVGLATALRIMQARPRSRLTLLEKENRLATHQTGHNSGVIHSGLYYRPGSLKASNCQKGYAELLEFCRRENIQHEICGKIVVATQESELPRLEELYRRGRENGLTGLRYLNAQEIREIEPHCAGLKALYVPQAGIVNYVEVAEKYAEKLRELGAKIFLGESALNISMNSHSVDVISSAQTINAKAVVVCAGIYSDRLARKAIPDLPLRMLPFRGEYYTLKPSAHHLVKNLIYPVPDPAFPFLGVHYTRMIRGGIECGPNAVFAWGREAYKKTGFNLSDAVESLSWPGFQKVALKYWRTGLGEYHRSFRKQAFVRALQRLIPEVKADDLEPGGAGIRAQACDREGNLLDDFDIRVVDRAVFVCNAPSPGATASLAIGATVSERVLKLLN